MIAPSKLINQAFIMAAGYGERMRPLTDDRPKPMVEINGKPLIDHILDDFRQHGIEKTIINTHYKAEVLEKHLYGIKAPQIVISHEKELLNTGGGLKNALSHFDNGAFFVINGDAYFEHNDVNRALDAMEKAWDPQIMDILILLEPVHKMHLTEGIGDYNLNPDGRAIRALNKNGAYMFTSLRINKTSIFANAPDSAFNYRDLMDEAQEKGRLYGLAHQGLWHHISTPEDVRAVNAHLAKHDKERGHG
ncbi:MAG: nucleotidyltransferase family protein [Alphaproteobacteria bacterium]